MITNILKSHMGRVVLSVILGLGLASLFRKVCDDTGCIEFISPKITEVVNNIYKHGGNCYKFEPETINCSNNKKKVRFKE